MARVFLTPIDLGKLEIRNAAIQNLAADPSSPVAGQVYYDTVNAVIKFYNGSAFAALSTGSVADASTGAKGIVQLAGDLAGTATSPQIASGVIVDADINAGAAIANTKLATNPLARANHTGTQTASTISDFATTAQGYRLDQFAIPTADLNINTHKLTNVVDPTSAQDGATKAYVDAVSTGLDVKKSVRVATTTNGTLASAYANGSTVDGVSLVTADRILLKDQTTGTENGIYTVNASGAPTRATDADSSAEVTPGMFTFIEEGTVNADSGWVMTNNGTITLGTTSLVFAQFSGAGQIVAGTGLSKSGNTLTINAAYVGQTSITTLGTIATGTWNGTSIAVANGGTGATSAAAARTNLNAAGIYSTATHSSGTTITITQGTHGLAAAMTLIVQVQDASSGDVVEADINVSSGGTVVVTFAASQTANTRRVTIFG